MAAKDDPSADHMVVVPARVEPEMNTQILSRARHETGGNRSAWVRAALAYALAHMPSSYRTD